jgi:HEAT repeat protein
MPPDESGPEKMRMTVASLVLALSSRERCEREQARSSLVARGAAAVGSLVRVLLASPDRQTRWEAAKALGQIGDPAGAPALVIALDDRHFGVQWLAAEGLISMGTAGLPPLLSALESHPESGILRDAAHHVLSSQADMGQFSSLEPLLQALDAGEPNVTIIVLAAQAREALESAAPR